MFFFLKMEMGFTSFSIDFTAMLERALIPTVGHSHTGWGPQDSVQIYPLVMTNIAMV